MERLFVTVAWAVLLLTALKAALSDHKLGNCACQNGVDRGGFPPGAPGLAILARSPFHNAVGMAQLWNPKTVNLQLRRGGIFGELIRIKSLRVRQGER